MDYFFSADTHYFHNNILKYCQRPFDSVGEMNEQLILNHNEVVSKNDTVVIVGDFSFANKEKTYKEIISRLNGHIILIRGSHDYFMDRTFHERWEKTIQGQKVVCDHYQGKVWPVSHYNSWQLYGHSHGKSTPVGKQMDVGVDTNNFYPYSFEQIKEIMDKKEDNFNFIKK